jgi:hypothetical protein
MKGKRAKYQKKLPHEVSKEIGFPHLGLQLTEDEIRESMANSKNITDACRYMGISLKTWVDYAKRYIDLETGKTLYEMHRKYGNPNVVRTRKNKENLPRKYKKQIDKLLTYRKWTSPARVSILKKMLILHELHKEQCEHCGYEDRRIKDGKQPLMLHFVDGDRRNWELSNIRWLCYNCYFIQATDPFSGRMLRNMESSPIVGHETSFESNLLFYEFDESILKEIQVMQNFLEEGRYTEEEDLVDFKSKQEREMDAIKNAISEIQYTKLELGDDEESLIDKRI